MDIHDVAVRTLSYGAMYLAAQDILRQGGDVRSRRALRRIAAVAPPSTDDEAERSAMDIALRMAVLDAQRDDARLGPSLAYRQSDASDWATGYLLAWMGVAEEVVGSLDTPDVRADAVSQVAALIEHLIRGDHRPPAYIGGAASGLAHAAVPDRAVDAWLFPASASEAVQIRWAHRALVEAGVPHPAAWACATMAISLIDPVLRGEVAATADTPLSGVRACMRYAARDGRDDLGWVVSAEMIRIGWYLYPRQFARALVRWVGSCAPWDMLSQTYAFVVASVATCAIVTDEAVRLVDAMQSYDAPESGSVH